MQFSTIMSKARIITVSAVALLAIYGFTDRLQRTDGTQQSSAKVGTGIGDKAPELAFMNADS
ncbi:MAG: hypothetical protein ACK6A5_00045, partial [Flavobacteriales bacterium]